jgi:para-aminobenzoate synthetase
MGSAAAPGSEVLAYDVSSGHVSARLPGGGIERAEGTIFEVLRRRLARRRVETDPRFDFCGGYVGYLGYELKSDLGSPGRHASALPDACLLFPGAFVTLDHSSGESHAFRVLGPTEDPGRADAELTELRGRLAEVPDEEEEEESMPVPPAAAVPRTALDRDAYLAAIAEAKARLRAGESYELCLTNRLEVEVGEGVDPLDLYLRLRRSSPAPESAYLRLCDAAVLSASPERFHRVEPAGRVSTSPIKGTRPRGADPEVDRELREELLSSAKERAENVMIVDVSRNDLGRVCEFGSIEVERLAALETFAHVHQLVSTVSGQIAAGNDAIDCVEACFPGGSMTGAPKLRAMEILDSLEPCARGPYSGALGWFGLDGALDLSIVIRSIVLSGTTARIGAGGAITLLSDPESEYEEMLLKARALLAVLRAPA